MSTSRQIALTGATGFVGQNLLTFLLEQGHQVQALARAKPGRALKSRAGLRWIEGTLEDPHACRRLTEGCDCVIHVAGAVRGAGAKGFQTANVEGTRRILAAAQHTPRVQRFLLLSSLAAREPELSHYANSKREAEQVLRQEAGELPWAALRPPAVYGPGDQELLPLFRSMARGFAPIAGPMEARFSMIHVQDLAAAIHAWVHAKDPISGIHEVDDGQEGGYSWDAVIAIVEAIVGRKIHRIRVPSLLLNAVALSNEIFGRLTHHAPMLTLGKIRELRHPDWTCDSRAYRQQSGWSPRILLPEGLARTPGWRT